VATHKWEFEVDPAVLGQMLELLAHDLRNPLSALHSNLGYLRTIAGREAAAPDVSEAVLDGLVSCEGLAHIIDNVSLLAQLLRSAAVPPAPPDLVDVFIADALQRVAGVTKAYGAKVDVSADAEASGLRIGVGREPFARAFTNIVLNAVQCSPRRSAVSVHVGRNGTNVLIDVRDMGTPLTEADPFGIHTQLATKNSSDGRYNRWLGLYIAALSARTMGGQLEVVSPPAPFTASLRLTLPLYSPRGAIDSP
jgi:two-component system OmpR family sensor kinase